MEILKNVAFDIMTKENADNIIVQYRGIVIMVGTPQEIFTVSYPTLLVRSVNRVCPTIPLIEVEIREEK